MRSRPIWRYISLRRIGRERIRCEEQRVAIGRGINHRAHRDVGSGTGLVLDDESLPQAASHALADGARNNIYSAARRITNDDLDGFVRVALR